MILSLPLLEIHKLAYFLQSAGEPLDPDYVKNKYEPYAEDLNHVPQRMEPFEGCLRQYIQDRLDISHDKLRRK